MSTITDIFRAKQKVIYGGSIATQLYIWYILSPFMKVLPGERKFEDGSKVVHSHS